MATLTPVPRGVPVPGLRAARVAALLTQEQLAGRAGLATATVVRLERGIRPAELSTVAKLARALGVAPRALTTAPPSRPRG